MQAGGVVSQPKHLMQGGFAGLYLSRAWAECKQYGTRSCLQPDQPASSMQILGPPLPPAKQLPNTPELPRASLPPPCSP